MFPSKVFVPVLLLSLAAGGLFESNQDIGTTPKNGAVEYNATNRTYQVTGGGADIWDQQDAFQFVYKKISGDFTLASDVRFSGSSAEQHRKAALLVRQSLAPDSPYAGVVLHGNGATALQYRPSTGVDTSEFRAAMQGPTHLSITRHGNEFSISANYPGVSPASAGPVIVSMQDPVYIGLAVCSHNAQALETALFSNMQLKAASR